MSSSKSLYITGIKKKLINDSVSHFSAVLAEDQTERRFSGPEHGFGLSRVFNLDTSRDNPQSKDN